MCWYGKQEKELVRLRRRRLFNVYVTWDKQMVDAFSQLGSDTETPQKTSCSTREARLESAHDGKSETNACHQYKSAAALLMSCSVSEILAVIEAQCHVSCAHQARTTSWPKCRRRRNVAVLERPCMLEASREHSIFD